MAPKTTDARFARLQTDPRFRRPNKKTTTVEIDERFKDVLESEEFGGKGKGKGKAKASEGARVDKRGRPITASHQADQLKRFYRLKSPSPSGEAEKPGFIDYARGEGNLASSGSEDEDDASEVESEADEEEMVLGAKKSNRLPQYDLTSEESDSDTDGSHLNIDLSEKEDEGLDVGDEEEEEEEGPTTEPTKRIAAVNLDWDNLRAADLYAVFNSFLSLSRKNKGEGSSSGLGRLVDVKIYPSQFGKERMEKEELEGPGGGIFAGNAGISKKNRGILAGSDSEGDDDEDEEEDEEDDSEEEGSEAEISQLDKDSDLVEEGQDDEDEEDDESVDFDQPRTSAKGALPDVDGLEILSDVSSEGDADEGDIDMDKLREYQLERLRYYYAVATFSSVAAAEFVMKECDGTEFERTANMFDLSYVPEDMDFGDDEVKDEATKELKGYKGNDFVTDALRHSKVKLTWDQDDPNRAKMTRRTLTREEIDEQDFNNLVGDSSGSEDEAEPAAGDAKPKKSKKQDLRALLLDNGDSDDDVWGKAGTAWKEELAEVRGQGKKDKANGDMEITFRPALSGASAVTGGDEENMTTLEKYQMRMKEKKARKKEKRELRAAGKAGSDDEGSDAEKPGKKSAKDDDFFGGSSDEEEEEALAEDDDEEEEEIVEKPKSSTKTPRSKSEKPKPKTVDPKQDLPKDLPEDLQTTTDHFSMKDILKAEKEKGKKKRRRNKKGGKHEAEREVELGPDGWKLDVKDDRFKVLHEEPEFAIDPSNPAFTKTQGMKDLLAERARVRAAQPHKEAAGKRVFKEADAPAPEKDLSSLVNSVKRRMDGQAKPRKRSRK